MTTLRVLAFLCALTAVPGVARATPNFPAAVASRLGLASQPDCTLCHVGQPARGTVTTPFGTTLRSRGAKAYDEASVNTALDALAAEQKDSDGDGASDIAELKAGEDPNLGAGESAVVPAYGCATGGTPDEGAVGAGILVALTLFATRKRPQGR